MKVGELKKLLDNFNDDQEVTITDGFQALCYRGNYVLNAFKQYDGSYAVDIGIGGCQE